MTIQSERTFRVLNRIGKWRTVFASWQLGTRTDTDAECRAVKDHREATMMLRIEVRAISALLVAKGVFNQEEFQRQVEAEAILYEQELEQLFPGFRATDVGMNIDVKKARETMKDWRP